MFTTKFKTVLLATILATSAAAAQADVITFEGIAASNSYKIYNVSGNVPLVGYALSTSATNAAFVFDSGYYAANSKAASNGTDYLRIIPGSSVTLTGTTNPLFSVNSIDLANYYYYNGGTASDSTATLTGTFANGTTISATYLLNNNNPLTTNDFTTELLSGFTNLTSFKIAATGYYLDIDNIVVTQGTAATADVPEPASLAILGLGLAGIAAVRRRKSA
jgi:hypothetical protein